MKTNDLIHALASDTTTVGPRLSRLLVWAAVAGLGYAAVVFVMAYGPRTDVMAAMGTVRFPFKLALAALMAASMAPVVARLARPGAPASAWGALAAVLILVAAVALELVVVPAEQWAMLLIGKNAVLCLISIPLLGAGMLAAGLLALRNGAPTRPTLAGAAVGLFAGAIGALFYAVHCPDDSPLFIAVWYSIALAIMTAVGATLGRSVLRW